MLAAALAAGGWFYVKKSRTPSLPQQSARTSEATATKGTISNTIVGTGNLQNDEAVSIKIPSGITVDKVYVSSGDQVVKGQVLAQINQLSVINAVYETQEELEELEEEMEEIEDAGEVDTDSALSVDSDAEELHYQKLKAQKEALEESLNELVALAESGKITASMDGTIENVYVTEGSGSTSSGSSSGSYQGSSMAAVQLSSSSSYSAANLANSSGARFQNLSGVRLVSLENTAVAAAERIAESTEAENPSSDDASVVQESKASGAEQGADSGENPESGTEETSDNSTEAAKLQLSIAGAGLSSSGLLVIEAPAAGRTPQLQIAASDNSYTGGITWNLSQDVFQAGATYQAWVTLQCTDSWYFAADSICRIEKGILSGISVSSDKKSLSFQLTFPETAVSGKEEGGQQPTETSKVTETPKPTETPKATETPKTSQDTENSQSSGSQGNGQSSADGSASGQQGSAQSSSGQSSSSQASSSQAAQSSSQSSSVDAEQYSTAATAFAISSNEQMILSVNVDELDINSVETGQAATITFDALEGREFTGEVKSIASTATSSGGVAKYAVAITMEKDSEMKTGMNASATIVIEEKTDVLTIPVNALQERGKEVFVYTSKDSEGNLSGETTVETGLSDGETVEILSGLSEGDTVYYQRTGNTGSGSSMGGPGGMEMPGGGNFERGSGGSFGDRGNMGGGNMNGGNMGGEMPGGMGQ